MSSDRLMDSTTEFGDTARSDDAGPRREASPAPSATDLPKPVAADLREPSDDSMRRLLDSLPVGAYMCDAEGLITYYNQRAVEIWGHTPRLMHPDERYCGSAKIFLPDGRPVRHDECVMVNTLREGRSFNGLEAVVEQPGGQRRTVLIHLNPLRDTSGKLVGGLNMLVDITDRRRMEEELRSSERKHRQLVENMGEGIWAADAAAVTTFVNPRMAELLGYRADELVGRPIVDFMRPEFARLVDPRQERRRRGITDRGEFEFVKRDGGRLLAEVTAYPLLEGQGEFAGSVAVISDVTERKRAEQDLRDSEARLHSVWENSVDGMRLTDAEGRIVAVNPAYCRLAGLPQAELLGQYQTSVYVGPQASAGALERYCQRFAARTVQSRVEKRVTFRTGLSAVIEISSSFIDAPQRPPLLLSIFRDITERKRAEELLHHSQKIEATGKLAGGVAHDFNNLLLVILNYSDLLLGTFAEGDPRRESVAAINDAAERAAALTRQLLAFSRRTMLEPKVLDLNAAMRETERLFQGLIGDDIQPRLALASDVCRVKVDPGQLSQIIINLIVNARDAMPQGGQLTIETKNVLLPAGTPGTDSGPPPGEYALLAISDTGHGMTPEVQAHIFEPFFTTKGVGNGTGLGLAVVHGIVKQSGGHVDFTSHVGVGTTFRIYFPAARGHERPAAQTAPPANLRGTETVLLVEDEEEVRALAYEVLRSHGYRVLEAGHGIEALEAAERHRGDIDLLLTDVVMPKMDGCDLAEVLARRYPALRVIYMSGYSDDAVLRRGLSRETAEFLPKPYSPAALAEKVRRVLDRA